MISSHGGPGESGGGRGGFAEVEGQSRNGVQMVGGKK